MEQYINKSAAVAEIERIKKEECPTDTYEGRCKLLWLEQFLSSINTLEVKDVDLEKESELIANEIMIGVQANKYHTNIYNTERNDFNHSHLWLAARKGIELGIKTKKGK